MPYQAVKRSSALTLVLLMSGIHNTIVSFPFFTSILWESNQKQVSQKLIEAASSNHETIMRSLLKNDIINVNATDKEGFTALMLAAGLRRHKIVQMLLSMPDINVDAANIDGNTALILTSDIKIVRMLLHMPTINVNHANNNGETALMRAAYYGDVELVSILIDAGARDPEHKALQKALKSTFDQYKQTAQLLASLIPCEA